MMGEIQYAALCFSHQQIEHHDTSVSLNAKNCKDDISLCCHGFSKSFHWMYLQRED
jgi:hypothetical protein